MFTVRRALLHQVISLPKVSQSEDRRARQRSLISGLLIAFATTASSHGAEVLREQVIQLNRGWNAVHLEVDPLDTSPTAVFAGTPVNIAARYFRLIRSVEFISNPADKPWKQEGWGVWYAPEREDAFLTSLHAIQGNQAYLIHSTESFQWRLTGKVRFSPKRWRNNSYNLVGFSLDSSNPPTFARFFSGADSKIGQKIYRLQDGKWVKILNPATTRMRTGEAFWTWCEGRTDYQGPLHLDLPGSGDLNFGTLNHTLKLQWHSSSSNGVRVESAASRAGASPGPPLPLHTVEKDLDTLTNSYPVLHSKSLSQPDGISSGVLSLHLRREEMTSPSQGALLKFTDGSGAVAWVPVNATKTAN